MEDTIKLEEHFDRTGRNTSSYVLIDTPKRTKKIRVGIIPNGFIFWGVTYEDMTPIAELKGSFTTRKAAVDAVKEWLKDVKPTEAAKHLEIFGEKVEPPVLKRKPVRAARA